jgi:hypothetical protein
MADIAGSSGALAADHIRIEEPVIDEVRPEDRALIKDVIALLECLQHPNKLCKCWTVQTLDQSYEVLATVNTAAAETEIFLEDLQTLQQLDPLRITSVSVRHVNGVPQIKLRVLGAAERVCVYTTDVIRVIKKRRLLHGRGTSQVATITGGEYAHIPVHHVHAHEVSGSGGSWWWPW